MATFSTIDRRLADAVQGLHDHLWHAPRKDETVLLRRIEQSAVALDRYVRGRGAISSGVRPLTRRFQKVPGGADLFEFLTVVSSLAGAIETHRRKPKEAAHRCSRAVVSLSIHLASAADRFDLVEAFEGGTSDFLGFTSALADVLEQKGVVRAGEFKRVANSVYDIHALWDDRGSKDGHQVAAVAAIGSMAYAATLFLAALRELGRYQEVPYGRLVPAMRRLLDRLGAHP